jgi:branched-chain amino acid transport system ATP-binding protein
MEQVVVAEGVSKRWGSTQALTSATFTIGPGITGLLGANGAGKTTLLKVISGLMPVTSGDIHLAGTHVLGASPDELTRAGLCMVPEGRGVFPNLTVEENLWLASYAGVPVERILTEAYARFPRLKERRRQLAGSLSGGEQQMLSLARALATKPALLLLDELSMGLAPIVVEQLYEIVAQVAKEGVSILVVEQFARAVRGIADFVGIMIRGRISGFGTPAAMESELSAAYLGE